MSQVFINVRKQLGDCQCSLIDLLVAVASLSCLLSLIPAAATLPVAQHVCIHDLINKKGTGLDNDELHVRHKKSTADVPCKEVILVADFMPLRVGVFYIDIETAFQNATTLARLKVTVAGVVQQLSSLLSVYPVNGTLALPRNTVNACGIFDRVQNKCLGLRPSYQEYCSTTNPPVLIPSDHLEGLQVWLSDGSKVTSTFDSGGVPSVDIIIYVAFSSDSQYCLTGAYAYTTVCKRNAVGRPIAAAVQLCPLLTGQSDDLVYMVLLHETFHALAFSSESFDYFVSRKSGTNCFNYHRTVLDNLGIRKLITPATLATASAHFNCVNPVSGNEYGGPLDTAMVGLNAFTGSHWNETYMQGSLMTAVISQPRVITLDNLTLAVFEDSGWYVVNYTWAQTFVFGRDAGCNFASTAFCQTDINYFCQSISQVGCHYLHRDKGTCKQTKSVACSVYVADSQSACYYADSVLSANASLTGETYGPLSRCFMSNLTGPGVLGTSNQTLQGRCYQHLCNGSSLLVKVWDSQDWMPCPYGSVVQVPGFSGQMVCPLQGILCSSVDSVVTTTILPPRSTLTTLTSTMASPPAAVHILIAFLSANFVALEQQSALDSFGMAVTSALAALTNISIGRIANTTITQLDSDDHIPGVNGSVLYTCFIVSPPADSLTSEASSATVAQMLGAAMAAEQFTVVFQAVTYAATVPISRSVTSTTVTPAFPMGTAKNTSTYVAVGVSVGVAVLAAVVIAVVCVCRRSRRAARHASSRDPGLPHTSPPKVAPLSPLGHSRF